MNDSKQRTKYVTIMVTLMTVLSLAAVGVAAADSVDRGTNTTSGIDQVFFPENSSGNVGSGATVYQGEEGITFSINGSIGSSLESTEGDSLSIDQGTINEGQTEAKYYVNQNTSSSNNLTVQSPNLNNIDMINENGKTLSSSAEIKEDEVVILGVNPTYLRAEDVNVSVEGPDGISLENSVVGDANTQAISEEQNDTINDSAAWSGANLRAPGNSAFADNVTSVQQGIGKTNLSKSDRVYWALDFSSEDSGQYTITIEGSDDFETGENVPDSATHTQTLQVTTEDEPQINLNQNEVTQGQRVTYTITGASAGDGLTVAIDSDDVRDTGGVNTTQARNLTLRGNVGDVDGPAKSNLSQQITFVNLTVDDDTGQAKGQIDSQYLDDNSVDVKLLVNNSTRDAGKVPVNNLTASQINDREIDDSTLNVEEGQITIDSPGDTYVPGQEVDLNGTASEGTEDVVVYAKDQDEWYQIDEINVASDGTWSEANMVLSDAQDVNNSQAASILSLPGIYRIGAVDLQGIEQYNTSVLNSTQFNEGVSTQRSIRVSMPALQGSFLTYDNEIFEGDDLPIVGQAVGSDELNKFYLGSNSDTSADTINVDSDDTFENNETVTGMQSGTVVGMVMSPGRDNQYGNGVLQLDPANFNSFNNPSPSASVSNFEDFVRDLGSSQISYTLDQLKNRVRNESVDDTGTDDLLIQKEFRLMDSSTTSIDHVSPPGMVDNTSGIVPIEPGETMHIMGSTNRNPEQTTIITEAIEGPTKNLLSIGQTQDWDTDGVWSTNISVPQNVTPGNYTFKASDDQTSDIVDIPIVAQRSGTGGSSDQTQQLHQQVNNLQEQVNNLQSQNQQLQSQNQNLSSTNQQLKQTNEQLKQQMNNTQPSNQTGGNESGGQGQPGFTVVVALVAILSVGAAALKRRD